MNIVLTLISNVSAELIGGTMGGLINILLVFVLLLAAILLVIAFFLLRGSRRTISKHEYEQRHLLTAPSQGVEEQQSSHQQIDQERQLWSPPAAEQSSGAGELKQCPFCGTEVLPGGIFCLYCGQRLPIPASLAASAPSRPRGEQRPAQVLTPSVRPSSSPSPELEDAHAREIEEHPTVVGEATVITEAEKQEKEEQPTLVEEVEAISVENQRKPEEEQSPVQAEDVVTVESGDQEKKEQEEEIEAQKTEEQAVLVEEEKVEEEESQKEVEAPVQVAEEGKEAEANHEKPGEEQPVAHVESVAIVESEEQEKQELVEPEKLEEEQPVAQAENMDMAGSDEQEEEEQVVQIVQAADQPVQETKEPETQGEEQPKQIEVVEDVQEESRKRWVEEQPTVMEMPAVAVEEQEKQGVLDMVEQSGYLILRKLNGKPVKEYPLNKPVITIGRARDNDIVIPRDKLSSRHHATVRYEHAHYALYDERSANGTFVNGNEIAAETPYVLQDGDAVGIGAYEFIYRTAQTLMEEADRMSVALAGVATSNKAVGRVLQEVPATEQKSMAEDEEDDGYDAITAKERTVRLSGQGELTESGQTLFEHLRFTAFHPKEVGVEAWNTLLVYTHIEEAMQAVYQDVNRLLREETESGVRRLLRQAGSPLPHGTNITIVPECRGVLFNPRRVTLQWSEDWHRSIFRFSARRELTGLSRNGRINIFAGPLLVGTLRMAMLFEDVERIDPLMEDAAITTKPYRRIYTSYSHQDQVVMQASQEMYRSLNLDNLLKVDQMRSNQVLSETVREGIEQAEVFQLFWSEHAAQSEYVRQEWEYGLQLNRGESFMRPVYWEVPLVKPPDALTPFYFSYLPAYAFASS